VKVLCDVYDYDTNHPEFIRESNQILQAIEIESHNAAPSWWDIFKQDEVQTGKRVLLAYGMQFMYASTFNWDICLLTRHHRNQVGGINLVVYYVPTVLVQNVGLDRNLALLLGGVYGYRIHENELSLTLHSIQCMFVIGSIVPSTLSDRLGRRLPMMVGSAGLGISMMLIAILLSFRGTPQQEPTSSAAVAFFFTVGFSALPTSRDSFADTC